MRVRSWVLTVAAVLLVTQAALAQIAVPSVRFRANGSANNEPISFERVEQTYFVDVTADPTSAADGFRNKLNIRFGNNIGADRFAWTLEFAMPEALEFTAGDYPGPARVVAGRGSAGYMSIGANGTDSFSCSSSDPRSGRAFTLIEITHDAEDNVVHSASISFVEVCVGKNLSGTIEYQRDGDFGDDGDDGGGDEPPTETPPPFQIAVPIELEIDPLIVGANGTQKVAFSTAITSGFSSDLHLSVETDALEHEDFHATITPAVIPAPGAGNAELTIQTGPLTFPRVYSVKLIATANDQVFERTFLVQVLCDPPFILGTNQPKSISAANGSQVTLEVTPGGTGPFFYQWYKGFPGMTRNPVLAANESKLIFTTRETATYWVRVSNACGTVNSTGATVTTTGTLSGPPRRRGGRS